MTKREAKCRAWQLAAEFLNSDLLAGAILSEDLKEEIKIEQAMEEIISGMWKRHHSMRR